MIRFILPLLLLVSTSSAQFVAPRVSVTEAPSVPTTYEAARKVLVQPSQPVAVLQPGRTTGILAFSLISEVNTQVFVRSNDARLVVRGDPKAPLTLGAYVEQTVNLMATAPHTGTITVTNTDGAVIAQVPYVIAPAKTVNQGINLNYSPSSARAGINYSISGINTSPLDPRWTASVNLGVNTGTGQISGGINVGVNW